MPRQWHMPDHNDNQAVTGRLGLIIAVWLR